MNMACISRTTPAVQHHYSSGSGVNLFVLIGSQLIINNAALCYRL